MNSRTCMEVFLFVPNLIGYFRLLLIIGGWYHIDNYHYFIPLYMTNVLLDGVDGWAARKLNQTSDYGARLDVILDLLGRGMVWSYVSKFGYAIIAFEWIVFLGNSERAKGTLWKESFQNAPYFVKLVMSNGFKTPLGAIAITGLHILPPWIYALQMNAYGVARFRQPVTFILVFCRIICSLVEIWCLYKYLQALLMESTSTKSR